MISGYVIDWSSWIAAFAAIISVVSACYAFKMQSKDRAEDFHISWNQDVVSWANLCIDSMSKMHIAVSSDAKLSSAEVWELRASLSSQIDQGRLLFENDKNTEYGADKPTAYRGYRPTFMDNLVRAYDNFSYSLDCEKKI